MWQGMEAWTWSSLCYHNRYRYTAWLTWRTWNRPVKEERILKVTKKSQVTIGFNAKEKKVLNPMLGCDHNVGLLEKDD